MSSHPQKQISSFIHRVKQLRRHPKTTPKFKDYQYLPRALRGNPEYQLTDTKREFVAGFLMEYELRRHKLSVFCTIVEPYHIYKTLSAREWMDTRTMDE